MLRNVFFGGQYPWVVFQFAQMQKQTGPETGFGQDLCRCWQPRTREPRNKTVGLGIWHDLAICGVDFCVLGG